MINNDTIVTSTIFGIGAGLMTEQWITIAVGAIAVGVIQPFFRILWTNLLISKKETTTTRRGTKMAYGKKRKSKKKKEDYKKKRRKRR
jgi:hypothetical protein